MSQPLPDITNDEIITRYRLAGVILPAERTAVALKTGRDMVAGMFWLRGPRTAAVEPSNTFSLVRKDA
jgi:hypothetical protein